MQPGVAPHIFYEYESQPATDNYTISPQMINKYWLLGFVEGDGSFFITNNSAVFYIRQKERVILENIANYIKELPLQPPYPNLFKPNLPNCIIRAEKNSKGEEYHSLTITDADVLFQYNGVAPLFLNHFQFFLVKN
jgi:hypothetical protein